MRLSTERAGHKRKHFLKPTEKFNLISCTILR